MSIKGFAQHNGTKWEYSNLLDFNVSDTKTLKDAIVDLLYPVGSIYISVKADNPSTYLGGGWTLQSKGKTLVGVDTSDTDFDTVKKTGGSKTVALTYEEMPEHEGHLYSNDSVWFPNDDNTNSYYIDSSIIDSGYVKPYASRSLHISANNELIPYGISRGNGDAHNNLQPYFTVYIWERVS